MNSQQIEYFLSAAKHLNFTRAADEFFTSQPTISRQISLLEDELGFDLFIREKSGLHLSHGGAIMAQEFSRSNAVIRDAIKRVELVSNGLEGEISIGYVTRLNTDIYIYPPTIAFMQKYPAIKMTIESLSLSRLRNSLETGVFDVIYTFDFELPLIHNALYFKCYTANLIIAMAATHPLASKKDLEAKDFSGETFCVPTPLESNMGRSEIVHMLKSMGIKDAELRGTQGIESMMFSVRSGIGVALLDSSMDLVYDNRYSYYHIPSEYPFSAKNLLAVWKRDNLNPILPIYLEYIKNNLDLD